VTYRYIHMHKYMVTSQLKPIHNIATHIMFLKFKLFKMCSYFFRQKAKVMGIGHTATI
jgi:hypothetical protein